MKNGMLIKNDYYMNSVRRKKIAVAMSGGVDSSVAAWLLKEEGHEVFGLHMRLEGDWNSGTVVGDAGQEAPVESARAACGKLGIDFHSVDLGAVFFDAVVNNFARTYLEGRTPNPCVVCNLKIKFGALLAEARRLGADALATGHYIIKKRCGNEWKLFRGADKTRDQSYFLYRLNQKTLDRVFFPDGKYVKHDLKQKAKELGLSAADRPESREICFIGPGGYGELVEKLFPDAVKPGPIVDTAGNEIGRHKGIVHYTIGQRKGLGIAAPQPLYVVALDPANNTITAGAGDKLFADGLFFDDAYFVSGRPLPDEMNVFVKIRYNAPPAPAVYAGKDENGIHIIRFDRPLRAVTPGQAAVLYDGEELLGGGTIAGAISDNAVTR